MQGINEWTLFAAFGKQKKRLGWLVIYAGMAFHSASVVSVLQPNTFYKTILITNPIPCATDPGSLSLDVADILPQDIQSQIDQLSYGIGLQLGNYVAQVRGNTTTSVAGRAYVKDNYAYGAIGDISDGLQEVPGVLFNARCGNEPDTPNFYDLWVSTFPGRKTPLITWFTDGSQNISDQPIPPEMRSIVSDPVFKLKGSEVAMYALVKPSGSGGVLMINATHAVLGCVWQAMPKLVSVQTVNFTAQSLSSQDSKAVPQLTGRAVLLTLQGMAQAVHLGLNIAIDMDHFIHPSMADTPRFTPISLVLQTLLADGGKAAFTRFNDYFSSSFRQHQAIAGVSVCNNNNRTVKSHWRFGNQYNLGWIAIVWTAGIGILAIAAAMWFTRRPKICGIKPLEVAYAFVLASVVGVDGIRKGSPVLSIRDGRLRRANTKHVVSVSRSRTI